MRAGGSKAPAYTLLQSYSIYLNSGGTPVPVQFGLLRWPLVPTKVPCNAAFLSRPLGKRMQCSCRCVCLEICISQSVQGCCVVPRRCRGSDYITLASSVHILANVLSDRLGEQGAQSYSRSSSHGNRESQSVSISSSSIPLGSAVLWLRRLKPPFSSPREKKNSNAACRSSSIKVFD